MTDSDAFFDRVAGEMAVHEAEDSEDDPLTAETLAAEWEGGA